MSEERNLRDEDPFLGLLVAGRYRVVAPLARGGMGRLYRAVQENLGREIALKILDIQELRDSTGGDAAGKGFADRFFLEAASVAKLSHPNTVTVHDYGTMDDGACFIAMELLHGRTLSELINADAPLAPRRAVRIALQVCASLAEAHAHGLVHRDLKPGNIMLIEHGADREFVKVLDFGLVKRENEESDLTASGALVGTPKYMAPEQVTGDNVGQWSDVYALGAVLYHMLTGHPPFVGDSKFALLAAHMNVKPTPMAEKTPGLVVPPALEAVVMRCLAKAPKDRFPSMEELAEALVACGDASALPASSMPSSDSLRILVDSGAFPPSTGSGERPIVRPAEVAGTAPLGTPPHKPSSRRAIVAAAVLVPVLAAGAWIFLRGHSSSASSSSADGPVAQAGPSTPPPTVGTASSVQTGGDPSEAPHVTAPVDPLGATPGSELGGEARVWLASEPPGAHASRGEFDLGDTPVTLVIPEGETWTIRLSAPGYVSRTVTATAGQGEVRARLTQASRSSRPSASDANAETGTDTATMSGQTMSGQTMSTETMSGQTMSAETMSGQTMSAETMSAETMSGQTMSAETMSAETTTDTMAAETSMVRGHTDNRDPWADP